MTFSLSQKKEKKKKKRKKRKEGKQESRCLNDNPCTGVIGINLYLCLIINLLPEQSYGIPKLLHSLIDDLILIYICMCTKSHTKHKYCEWNCQINFLKWRKCRVLIIIKESDFLDWLFLLICSIRTRHLCGRWEIEGATDYKHSSQSSNHLHNQGWCSAGTGKKVGVQSHG